MLLYVPEARLRLGLHRVTGLGYMQQWQGTCSSTWQEALLPSPLGRDRNGGHSGTQKKGKQKETNQKTEESHPG